MIIVGGTYQELVVQPESSDLLGSGMRAAAALANRSDPPTLHTALDSQSREEAELVASSLRVRLGAIAERDELVAFRYLTPISTPAINGPNSRLVGTSSIDASDETALVFGMVEAPTSGVKVAASRIILDPQRPRDAEPLVLDGLEADEYLVVANVSEMRKLGQSNDLRAAASQLLATHPQVLGTITKRGAAGCLVSRRHGSEIEHTIVGAHPTDRVWPIGSGDVFSAGFAHAIDADADLVEAARLGSAAAAHWCSTRSLAITPKILASDFSDLPPAIDPARVRVYLAGPFFTLGERWLVETVRDELLSLGVEVWSPVHEVGPGGLEVAIQDLAGLNECDVMLALLDHGDPGTIFEVGWAARQGMPIIGYGQVIDGEGAKMLAGTSVEIHRDLSTACYRAAWAGMGLRPRPGWAT